MKARFHKYFNFSRPENEVGFIDIYFIDICLSIYQMISHVLRPKC